MPPPTPLFQKNLNTVGNEATYVPGSTELADHVQGVCLSMVLMWAQQTLRNPTVPVTQGYLEDHQHLVTLRQTAYQFAARANRRAAPAFKMNVNADLLNQYQLQRLADEADRLLSWWSPLFEMCLTPGCYYFAVSGPNGGGHAFGFKFQHNAESFWFDPNGGLYRWATDTDLVEWLDGFLTQYSYRKYLGGQYRYWRLDLG